MINITNPEDCCGCTACQSICGQDAIKFKSDALGFKYPKIDLKKCINCGLCEKVCSFNDHYDVSQNYSNPIAYGVRHKQMEEVLKSRSGAAFAAISDYILDNDGIIYGVGFNEDFTVCHKRASNKTERDEFRGSKYVQSDLNGIFKQVRQDLINGKLVMFVGTACQTSGLNSFIGKKLRRNLFLVDIICHGTPSNGLWHDYLQYLEKSNHAKIKAVNFRDKQYGWESHKETYKLDSGETFTSVDTNFYKNIFFRKSCGVCHFCNTKRPSDITLGDFWGWDKANIKMNNDDKGINLLLINTQKGEIIFNMIKHKVIYQKVDDDSYMQPNLHSPTKTHPYRDILEWDYSHKGFEYVFFHNYDKPTIIDRIRRQIRLITKRI